MVMAFIASVLISHSLSVRGGIDASDRLGRGVNLVEFLFGNAFNFLCVMLTSPVYLVPIEVTQLWVARACAPRASAAVSSTTRPASTEAVLLACATATCVCSIVLASSSKHKACKSARDAKRAYAERAWVLVTAVAAGLAGTAATWRAALHGGKQGAPPTAMTVPATIFLMSIVLHSGALIPALTSDLDKLLPRALDVTRFDAVSCSWVLALVGASLAHILYQNMVPTRTWFGSMTDAALPVHQGSYIVLSGIVAYLFSGRLDEAPASHSALYVAIMLLTLVFLTSYGIVRSRV
tara:strand:+ start:492 stop:1373 length:882 start_codon:yes stop_codon:yes gene_type:complete